MASYLPPLRLTGATLLRDGALQQRSISIADGLITRGPLPEIDMSGYLILPGIIDMHGDAFERHIAPRPSAPFPTATGLASADRDAAANGVTTAWLAQCWSWEGGLRGPDYAVSLMDTLETYRTLALTDLRLQIRAETHMIDSADQLLAAVRRYGIDYVVFNNHLNEAVEMHAEAPETVEGWAARHGRTVAQHMQIVHAALAREIEVPRHLCRLAEAFDTLGVTYGSHDDPDAETRERFSMIGARIAEFPTTRKAAAASRAIGDPIVMGAPNVVRGGSQSGNIAALSLIADGLCDALVSDYYYPALAAAAWEIVDRGVLDLARAWALISTRPAEIMRLGDRGHLGYGRRADLVIVNADNRAIEATISGGNLSYLAGEAAHRFLGAGLSRRMAAE